MTNDLISLGTLASPRSWNQLGIFLLDGSGSMSRDGNAGRPLADDTNTALQNYLAWFKGSSKVNNFSVAVITFGEYAEEHTPPTPLAQVDEALDYNPLLKHGDGTDIGMALEKAEAMALAHLNQPEARNGIPHTVRIIMMTDGMCLYPAHTLEVAQRLRDAGVELFCALFIPRSTVSTEEVKEAKALMQEVVGKSNNFSMTYDEPALREFFKRSNSTNVVVASARPGVS